MPKAASPSKGAFRAHRPLAMPMVDIKPEKPGRADAPRHDMFVPLFGKYWIINPCFGPALLADWGGREEVNPIP
jgi:hypothetical protein